MRMVASLDQSQASRLFSCDWVAASKPKALGMVSVPEAIPKLRLRLPPSQTIKSDLTDCWKEESRARTLLLTPVVRSEIYRIRLTAIAG
jgi:hypothetical protein